MLGRAFAYAYLGTSLWLAGYLYGHHVAERGDSDPESVTLLCGEPMAWMDPDDGSLLRVEHCQRPAGHTGEHNGDVPPNVEAMRAFAEGNGG